MYSKYIYASNNIAFCFFFASESIFLASDDLILSIAVLFCVRLNSLWLIGVVRMCLRKLVSVSK